MIAAHDAIEATGIDVLNARAEANLGHHRAQRLTGDTPVQPMPARVIVRITPQFGIAREIRIGPRVPCPDVRPRHIDHRPAIDLGHGVVGRIPPIVRHRTQILRLNQVIAPPVGIGRQAALGRFRVQKLVRLVRALVDRGTAVFGEHNRFGLRHPPRRHSLTNTVQTIVMLVSPPVADVLIPEHPILTMGAIGDRAAQLGLGFQRAGVIPIIALAALDIRLQVTQVIDVLKRRIGMIITRPPIGQRHIVINPDEIDVLIRPQRVQMEQNIARPVLRVIAEIFAPIRRIGDIDIRPQNGAHIGGQLDHRLNRRKGTGVIADRRDPAHFRADAKRIHPACGLAQMGIVQHEPPIAPIVRRTVIPQIAVLPANVGQ